MKLIVGLGNIGNEYAKTRHNAGFLFADALQEKIAATPFKEEKKFKAFISEGNINGEKVLIAKPTTFMNLSGEAVSAIATFYKIPIADIWVIYDDLDIPLGSIRIRPKGSPGTHNGIKSVTANLGTENFPRIRIGVEGRIAEHRRGEASDYVLSRFMKEEQEGIKQGIARAVEGLTLAITSSIAKAMETLNE